MEQITIVILPKDDSEHDQALPFAEATAEFMNKVLGMHIVISDGFGNTTDFH